MKILCVHQGYELYGSDRTFVTAVAEFRAAFPQAEISVLLPKAGPLADHLRRDGFTVRIGGVLVLRRRHVLRFLATAPLLLSRDLASAWAQMRRADIVYINTIVVLNFLLMARRHPCAIVHVHEIPPLRHIWLFRQLLSWSRARVVFNSRTTAQAFGPAQERGVIVHNGARPVVQPAVTAYDGSRPLRVLMLGRLSRAKGQDLLLEALSMLPEAVLGGLTVRIVGDAFEGACTIDEICQGVGWNRIADQVSFRPFAADPDEHYRWCDLVVMPSRHPESFGLVAIEGMAHGRAIAAADHGGVTEIVQAGRTGWLFAPNSAPALAECLTEAVLFPEMVRRFGEAGHARFFGRFHADLASAAFRSAVSAIVHARYGTGPGRGPAMLPDMDPGQRRPILERPTPTSPMMPRRLP